MRKQIDRSAAGWCGAGHARSTADTASLGIWQSAGQEQKPKPVRREGGPAPGGEGTRAEQVSKKGKALKADVDSLMDEIDEVLEENAEEFVKNYVQRGGE